MSDFLQVWQFGGVEYRYLNLGFWSNKYPKIESLPFSLKILLENVLRKQPQKAQNTVELFLNRQKSELEFSPARVLMQDFTGVPAVVDLAAMRDAMAAHAGDVNKVNPFIPVDLVIDHSVMVDQAGHPEACHFNTRLEYQRNHERYKFLKWGQQAFKNFRVVPPGTGICHQINLEYLAKVVWQDNSGDKPLLYPDTLVGTDSHTTMINGLGVLGWGVGGIEAEAAMLGQSLSMLLPQVLGVKLIGELPEGSTATDLVLTITNKLRQQGVVGKFVEFFGSGLQSLTLADMATISNMTPEFGATCGFFPVCQQTLDYLHLSGRKPEQVALVEAYCKKQGLFWEPSTAQADFDELLEVDLSTVRPSLAGPRRPQDKILLGELAETIKTELANKQQESKAISKKQKYPLKHGDVVLAAITSCTNTSNPQVMLAAGLVAKKACQLGLQKNPWVKTSLAPGSKVVSDYLVKAGLQEYLDQLGFNLAGYGCTTCIGNSGDLEPAVSQAIQQDQLSVAAVLSGNRNFEGRVHPEIKLNLLASPPLVVAYALAGTTLINLEEEPLAKNDRGEDIFLSDIWPSSQEIKDVVAASIDSEMFNKRYAQVFDGDQAWAHIEVSEGDTYKWDNDSTYVQNPPYFTMKSNQAKDQPAHILAMLGDSITTDHISPAGSISKSSPAAAYLYERGVTDRDFNSYGSRRGNHQVMMRGTFANIRLRNEMAAGKEGGYTRHIPNGQIMSIYDAALEYQKEKRPLVVIAGKDYGCGSSRDWAAKGTALLGVVAVIAESFERIHRSNLVGMSVLPLQFAAAVNRKTLGLKGDELITLPPLDNLQAQQQLQLTLQRGDGSKEHFQVLCRIDTANELACYRSGGILSYVLQQLEASEVV